MGRLSVHGARTAGRAGRRRRGERRGLHELGSHGFSISPRGRRYQRQDFDHELAGVRKTSAFAGEKELTLVYPRNQIGYARELGRHGFVGYRDTLAVQKHQRSSRWRHLFDEANPFPASQEHAGGDDAVARIPAGRMLNWRSGARAAIPIAWTARLWRKTLDDAVRTGGAAHVWSHPHNFITGRDMFDLLDSVLKAAAPRIRGRALEHDARVCARPSQTGPSA